MNILLLSRYSNAGSSSRYRSFAYLPYLKSKGHVVTVAPLLNDRYIDRLYANRSAALPDIFAAYARRITDVLSSTHYDLLWLEGEVFPWLPFRFERLFMKTNIPYVVDYDDALFHKYDLHSRRVVRLLLGRKIDEIMANASVVIAGNGYLAARAQNAGARRIEIIPTIVDTHQFHLLPPPENSGFTLGWIGSPSTAKHLAVIHKTLQVATSELDATLVTVGIRSLSLDGARFEVVQPWSEAAEVEQMARFDVGIMPLPDEPWERGKCGHKLLKYMACGRPVVASNVGVNAEIVENGVHGFLASTDEEWLEALRTLHADRALRGRMGIASRYKIESVYSLDVNAPKLECALQKALT